jgi:hypothetical protein
MIRKIMLYIMRSATQFWLEHLKEISYFWDISIEERMILKLIIEKLRMWMCGLDSHATDQSVAEGVCEYIVESFAMKARNHLASWASVTFKGRHYSAELCICWNPGCVQAWISLGGPFIYQGNFIVNYTLTLKLTFIITLSLYIN